MVRLISRFVDASVQKQLLCDSLFHSFWDNQNLEGPRFM